VLFCGNTKPEDIRAHRETVALEAEALGRGANAVQSMAGFTAIVGRTEAEAQAKLDRLQASYHLEGMLANQAGSLGIDLSRYRDDEPIASGQPDSPWLLRPDGSGQPLTVGFLRQRLRNVAARRDAVFIGTPGQVADQLEAHARISGARAYMLLQLLAPGTLEDFVTLVVPELVARGLFRDRPPTGTLRSRFAVDGGDRLPASHRGASFRFPTPFAASSEARS
jgi:long-chain alkane monooxygenase